MKYWLVTDEFEQEFENKKEWIETINNLIKNENYYIGYMAGRTVWLEK